MTGNPDFPGVADARTILAGLDDEQRAAVTAPAGPVCVLAGAGTGKTRAISHRIAYRVLSDQIQPRHVLAVTFTARAAGQLRERLAALGTHGVQARTFHAAALRQLRFFAPRLLRGREMPELVESKGRLVTLAAARAGVRADKTTARDLAGEIEWAKSSLVEPSEYAVVAAKAQRETPLDAAQVASVFTAYEQLKRAGGVIDFEDLLRAMVWGIEEHSDVAEQIRGQYRHFVIDEYQDVNPLQHRLLDAWLGGRRDITVVGDVAQTIYSFTGATSSYLVDFPRQHRDATVVRLVRDYRSTPQVVGLANAVIAQARGAQARLRLDLIGQRPAGPEPEMRVFSDEPTEAATVARRCAELIAAGVPAAQIAVLFRTNAQSESYEKALADVDVPYVLRGGERFFHRTEVRQAMASLRGALRTGGGSATSLQRDQSTDDDLPALVGGVLSAQGWQPERPPTGGAARDRWESFAALVRLAADWRPDPDERPGLGGFVVELERRAQAQHAPTVAGVTLASLHSAKGLEWDAVFLVGLAEGTLPTTYARSTGALEEERRLLYVGITRAREWLWLSYGEARSPGGRARRPSRFLEQLQSVADRSASGSSVGSDAKKPGQRIERRKTAIVTCRVCGATLLNGVERKLGRCADCPSTLDEELFERLKEWRALVATTLGVQAYVVFTDATLTALAERQPSDIPGLLAIAGIGPRKLELYGEAVRALLAGAAVRDVPLPEPVQKI